MSEYLDRKLRSEDEYRQQNGLPPREIHPSEIVPLLVDGVLVFFLLALIFIAL